MQKTIKQCLLLILMTLSLNYAANAQKKEPKEEASKPTQLQQKPLVLQGDLVTFQTLLRALDGSEAPHNVVVQLKQWIEGQLLPQLQQQSADSTGKKK